VAVGARRHSPDVELTAEQLRRATKHRQARGARKTGPRRRAGSV